MNNVCLTARLITNSDDNESKIRVSSEVEVQAQAAKLWIFFYIFAINYLLLFYFVKPRKHFFGVLGRKKK